MQMVGNLTQEEWDNLPATFGSSVMAKVIGRHRRFAQNNYKDLGGVRVGRTFIFSKKRAAEILGIDTK